MLSKRLAARWYALVKRIAEPGSESAEIGGYLDAMPDPQNAVDLIPGWNHALPPDANATAGPAALYNDTRIGWFLEQFGSVDGKRASSNSVHSKRPTPTCSTARARPCSRSRQTS